MKDLYYSTKLDRAGNKLTVAYVTAKNRDKYAGDGAKQDTVMFADFNEEGRLALTDKHKHEVHGAPLRAMLVNNGPINTTSGSFVIYGKRDNVWSRTAFSFDNFSAANTAMKAMIGDYQALLIRDESTHAEDVGHAESNQTLEIGE